jgi:hypothetical protein
MPLTPQEIAFLGPVMAESAEVRIGPAWTLLRQRGIKYSDVIWLLEAYKFVDPPRLSTHFTADGTEMEVLEFGREIHPIPECPWPDVFSVRQREQQLEIEVRELRSQFRKDVPL